MISTGLPEADLDGARALLEQYADMLDMQPSRVIEYPTPFRQDGFIYFVTCDRPDFPIKIGWATDTDKRIAGLQGGLPYPVLLLATVPGTVETERRYHIGFSAHRLEGEWFERTPELLALINSLNTPLPPPRKRIAPEDV
mgnify:CR=1 FL=1